MLEIKCVRCGTINSLFKEVSDQVVVTDPNGIILFVNPILEKVTGYKASEVIGKTPAVWGKQMSEDFYKTLWHTVKVKKVPIATKIINRRKDGTVYKATLRITPVLDAEGKITLFIGMETISE